MDFVIGYRSLKRLMGIPQKTLFHLKYEEILNKFITFKDSKGYPRPSIRIVLK